MNNFNLEWLIIDKRDVNRRFPKPIWQGWGLRFVVERRAPVQIKKIFGVRIVCNARLQREV